MVVLTTDARMFEGILEGFDNSTNIVLSTCIERIVGPEYQQLEMGVYMIRGTNVVCIGAVERDVKWEEVNGDKLKGTKNPL